MTTASKSQPTQSGGIKAERKQSNTENYIKHVLHLHISISAPPARAAQALAAEGLVSVTMLIYQRQ